jgi:hypothetical protein
LEAGQQPLQLRQGITLGPRDGIWVQCKPRSSSISSSSVPAA